MFHRLFRNACGESNPYIVSLGSLINDIRTPEAGNLSNPSVGGLVDLHLIFNQFGKPKSYPCKAGSGPLIIGLNKGRLKYPLSEV
jgi:hypothetical protein